MKETKKLAFSSIAVALGVVLMSAGALFEPIDLAVCCLASTLMLFIYIEVGKPYTYLTWICTSLITFLIFPSSTMWAAYLLVFGIYPIMKGLIERAPHGLWWLFKLLWGAFSLSGLFLVLTFILGVKPDDGFFGLPMPAVYAITAALGAVCFLLFDVFLTAAAGVYETKLRDKIKNILK